ncbi:MAG TPA: CBS domain-containing protein [Myxococcales bacterium]
MASIQRNVVREVVSLEASAPCREAARLMAQKRIGAVAVKQGGRIVGFVSERDLILRCLVGGGTCEAPILEAMRSDLPSVDATASESECANLMRDHYTRHLLVEEDGRVAGIISMRDVIVLMLDEKQFLIDQLNVYISGR